MWAASLIHYMPQLRLRVSKVTLLISGRKKTAAHLYEP